jgi:hypothetical protein
VTVWAGGVELHSGEQSAALDAGHVATIDGTGDDAQIAYADASSPADWDQWEVTRAQRVDRAPSYRHVSTNVYGAEDLDDAGTWSENPTYGPIWQPTNVQAGWAPYTDGRWVWEDPWGWVWVDAAPWGWAPSHYGRWVYANDAWAWAPGPIVPQPVFAPAVVGFLGFGGGGISVGIGVSAVAEPVGWVPLGWGEPIVPWWGGFGGVVIGHPFWGGWGGPRIVNNTVINQTTINNINVNNIRYTNIDRPGGVTVVGRDRFADGVIRRGDVHLQPAVLREARPIGGRIPVVPTRQSLTAVDPARASAAAKPRFDSQRQPITAVRTPRLAPPKFDQKVEEVRSKRAPLAPTELTQLASRNPRQEAQLVNPRATGRNATPADTARIAPQGGGPGNERGRTNDQAGRASLEPAAPRQPAARGEAANPAPRERQLQQRPADEQRPGVASVPRPDTSRERGQEAVSPRSAVPRPSVESRPEAARPAERQEHDRAAVSPRDATPPRSEPAPEARSNEPQPSERRAAIPKDRSQQSEVQPSAPRPAPAPAARPHDEGSRRASIPQAPPSAPAHQPRPAPAPHQAPHAAPPPRAAMSAPRHAPPPPPSRPAGNGGGSHQTKSPKHQNPEGNR